VTKEHPDKGGDPEKFKLLQQAYETLSDPEKVRLLLSMFSCIRVLVVRSWQSIDRSKKQMNSVSMCVCVQRKVYDATGKVVRTAEEEFVDSFGGGMYIFLVFVLINLKTFLND
jgi:hypothetical protein